MKSPGTRQLPNHFRKYRIPYLGKGATIKTHRQISEVFCTTGLWPAVGSSVASRRCNGWFHIRGGGGEGGGGGRGRGGLLGAGGEGY